MANEDDGLNGSLAVPGSGVSASLVPFLRACNRKGAGRYRIRAEVRYFSVIDTQVWASYGGHTGGADATRALHNWVNSSGGSFSVTRGLDTDVLFLARSGDRYLSFETFAFFHRTGSPSGPLAWIEKPSVADFVIAHNLDALLVPASPTRPLRASQHSSAGLKPRPSVADLPAELVAIGGQYYPADLGIGGRATGAWSARKRDGVNLLRARALVDVLDGSWLPWRQSERVRRPAVLLGNHSGCLDMMDRSVPMGQPGSCGFDGKFSLARFRGRYLLYARANTRAGGGGRFVQVAETEGDDPAGPFGPFRLIDISGYDATGRWTRGGGLPDIYFAAVKPSPIEPDILLGLFPVNLGVAPSWRRRGSAETAPEAFVGLAASCDGVHFSRLERLLATVGVHGRTHDQPADGFTLRNGIVHFYVQRDVPGISPAADERARLVRYALRPEALARITAHARATLAGCTRPQAAVEAAEAAGLRSTAAARTGSQREADAGLGAASAADQQSGRGASQPLRDRPSSANPSIAAPAALARGHGGVQPMVWNTTTFALVMLVLVGLALRARRRRHGAESCWSAAGRNARALLPVKALQLARAPGLQRYDYEARAR